ncbi:hypothetical protein StoSoilA2_31060 [Arthrobacter sp. StoSoilA2]|nr:hypothetical protein StoSoilA2_31060 [Arthrobacter sp. StoSoilA2]
MLLRTGRRHVATQGGNRVPGVERLANNFTADLASATCNTERGHAGLGAATLQDIVQIAQGALSLRCSTHLRSCCGLRLLNTLL